jgi:hypothetical protein
MPLAARHTTSANRHERDKALSSSHCKRSGNRKEGRCDPTVRATHQQTYNLQIWVLDSAEPIADLEQQPRINRKAPRT